LIGRGSDLQIQQASGFVNRIVWWLNPEWVVNLHQAAHGQDHRREP
jgi:hypothetical protein